MPGNFNILVDAGNDSDANYILAYLQNLGIKRIDLLIQTHPHQDHIGAMDEVIYTFEIGSIIAPDIEYDTRYVRNFYEAVKAKGIDIHFLDDEDEFFIGSTHILLFRSTKDYGNINLNSIVTKISYGKNKFLLMGDNEGEVLKEFQRKYQLEADVIKIGHHGSLLSTPTEFIKAVNPKIAIITARKNSGKYPHQKTVDTLKKFNVETHITNSQGAIIISSDGDKIHLWRSEFANTLMKSLEK